MNALSSTASAASSDPLVPKQTPFNDNVGINYESWEAGRTGYSMKKAQFTNRTHDLSMTTARHVRGDAFSRQPR